MAWLGVGAKLGVDVPLGVGVADAVTCWLGLELPDRVSCCDADCVTLKVCPWLDVDVGLCVNVGDAEAT